MLYKVFVLTIQSKYLNTMVSAVRHIKLRFIPAQIDGNPVRFQQLSRFGAAASP
jgi:hypothetical protein